ncbi:MAG: hypothetical protein RL757_1836 [Bacteroidota bacterium]|jgi:hypothetical protein
MKYWIFVGIFIVAQNVAIGQTTTWKTFADLKFKKKYDEGLGMNVDYPVFSKNVKKLENSIITLEGYVISESPNGDLVLSQIPNSQIDITCGRINISPSKIFNIQLKKHAASYLNKKVKIKGILVLNNVDNIQLPYTLKEAEIIDF